MNKKLDKSRRLNKEQLAAIKHGEGPLLVIAGAGTGKTTVITERIKNLIEKGLARPEEILALTFTEKAAKEMEERVDIALPYGYTNMWIMTFHSFCERVLRQNALHIGLDPRFKLTTEAETVQLIRENLFSFKLKYFRPLGNPYKFIDGIIQHFSRLQDEDINASEYIHWAKSNFQNPIFKKDNKVEADKWLELANAYKIYEELKVQKGYMDFGDLITKTLKLFRDRPNILKEYQKQFKYILIDEFQDTNYSQNQLALLLSKKNKNINVVGDDDQCLPPDAKISSIDKDIKIKDIKIGDEVLTAVGKGQTSLSKVNKIFRKIRDTRFLTFKTETGKTIEVTDNHKMFCFLPAHLESKDWHFVYIMYHPKLGWRIGITSNLPNRLRMERYADKIIGIGSYKTDEEARFFEAYYSAKYGIPTIPFTPRPNQAISGDLLTRLFKDIDTRRNILSLSDDLKIELESPQFLVGAITRGESRRIKINFEMCARNYIGKSNRDGFIGNPSVLHLVSLETSNKEILKKLTTNGISLTKARKGMRVRDSFSDIKEAWAFADKLKEITDGIIDKRFKVGRFNYQHLPARIVPASHVFSGMYLPVLRGRRIVYEKVISRTEMVKRIETYDLEIEKTHNFIADGIVVHNSVYRFRGAAISNIIQFRTIFPKAKIVVLTKNYRSTQEILDRSYDLIQHNNPDRLEVVEKISKKLVSMVDINKKMQKKVEFIHSDRVENEAEEVAKIIYKHTNTQINKYSFKDFAILVRANNHAEPFTRALSRYGIPFQFLGPGRLFKQSEIIDLIAYLRVLYNFEDSPSFYRILTMSVFSINPRDIAKLGNQARKHNTSLFEVCERMKELEISEDSKTKITKIVEMIHKHLGLLGKEGAGQILYYFLEETGLLRKLVIPETKDAENIANNISKFFDKLKTYEVDHPDVNIFSVVDWLDLSAELGESPLAANSDWGEINAVNILTVHSAKGLEFPVVFLVNLVSQRFPTTERHEQIPIPDELIKEVLPFGDYHLEEERRLFYVGMTRAKERLFLTAANFYGDGKRDKKISPFIGEALGEKVSGISYKVSNVKELGFKNFGNQIHDSKYEKQNTKINYLSYSQIETFRVCPLHYKLKYIYKIPTPPSASASFGTSIHNTLKNIYEMGSAKNLNKRSLSRILDKLLKSNWIREGYLSKKHEEEFFEKGVNYLKEYLKKNAPHESKTISLEESFIIPVSKDLKIGGKIDRVDDLGNGKVEIWDYKTGANVPTQKDVDHDLQLTFYALAATTLKGKSFGKKPEDILLTLYYFDGQKKITTTRTEGDLIKAKEEILRWRDEIEKSDFKCSGGFLCQNCEFKLFCQGES